jgi:hypothetical protein
MERLYALYRRIVPLHHGVACHASGMDPIRGRRYTRGQPGQGEENLCEDEWAKLPPEEQRHYALIERPRRPAPFDPAVAMAAQQQAVLVEAGVPAGLAARLLAAGTGAPPVPVPAAPFRTRAEFPSDLIYGEYIRQTLQPGMVVRARTNAEGTIELGDTGRYLATNGGAPPCQVHLRL